MLLIRFMAIAQQSKILFIIFFTVPTFQLRKNTFLNEIAIAHRSIIDQDEIKIIQTFLYGNLTYFVNDNRLIIDARVIFGNQKI